VDKPLKNKGGDMAHETSSANSVSQDNGDIVNEPSDLTSKHLSSAGKSVTRELPIPVTPLDYVTCRL
jgi:hypothetical protein